MGACEYHNVIIIILISGKDRFMAMKAHFLATGLTTRVNKWTMCLPHNALSIFRWGQESHLLPQKLCWDTPSSLGVSLDTREMMFSCYRLVPPVSGTPITHSQNIPATVHKVIWLIYFVVPGTTGRHVTMKPHEYHETTKDFGGDKDEMELSVITASDTENTYSEADFSK